LNGNVVTKTSGFRVIVGSDPEVHLADAFALNLCKGPKHAAGAEWGLQLFISNFELCCGGLFSGCLGCFGLSGAG